MHRKARNWRNQAYPKWLAGRADLFLGFLFVVALDFRSNSLPAPMVPTTTGRTITNGSCIGVMVRQFTAVCRPN